VYLEVPISVYYFGKAGFQHTGLKISAIIVCPTTWKNEDSKPATTRIVTKIAKLGATAAPTEQSAEIPMAALNAIRRPTI